MTDTIGGQTNALLGSTAATLPHVRSGRLRALAVTTSQRLAAEPSISTVAESGVPAPVIERLDAEVNKILQLRETAEQLQNDGVSPAGGSADQFLAAIKKEIEVWRKVVNDAGVKTE